MGRFLFGQRYETSGGMTWRPNSHVLVDLSESYNKVRYAKEILPPASLPVG